MAQRVRIELIDDLNGETAQETVRFGIDGIDYEIDLTTENSTELRSALSQYVEKGRKLAGERQSQSARQSRRDNTQQIRQWARENEYKPSSRGRITGSIIDAYNEARE